MAATWTTIDTRTGQTSWGSGEARNFVLGSTPAAARYFKIVVTANNGDTSYTDFGEIYLYLAAVVPVDGVIEPWLTGSFRRGLIGSWLISTPGSTPAVQLPAGMIVSVSC
jgi:hypothetical protein